MADRLLRPGEIVLDIGAGEGRFTLSFASRIAPGGVVHAFEPRSDAVTKNRMAAKAHGLDSFIRFHSLALADRNGEAEFHRDDARPGLSTLHRYRPDEITRATTVPVATLDAVFPTEQAGFIKLDAQGGEFAVISGGMAVIARSAPFIIFQNARAAASAAGGYGPDAFFALFDQLGLTLFDAFGSPFTPGDWRDPHAGWYFCAFDRTRLDPHEFHSVVAGFWRERLREHDEFSAVTGASAPALTRTTAAAAGVDLAVKYEALIDTLADRLMPRGACVIDAGANVGRHTIPFARRVGPAGRVHAFEPQDDIMERNRSAARAAGLAAIIRYHGHGLADAAGDTTFMRNDAHPGLSSLRQLHDPEVTRAITVRLDRLDDVLPGENVDFIKLDIEGAEYAALRGGMHLIARTGPFIVMENGLWQTSRRYGYTREDFFRLFGDLGFELFDAFGHRLTRSRWYSPGAGWYFCAFPRSRLDPHEYRAIVTQFWNNCMPPHSGGGNC